jgi:hypothetical protein
MKSQVLADGGDVAPKLEVRTPSERDFQAYCPLTLILR